MITTNEAQALLTGGGNVVGHDNDKIGSIGQVFLDDSTGEPAWVTVKTGLFGGGESFVPLAEATVNGNDVAVPYDKAKVKDAPRVEADRHLSVEEEAELYRFYGLDDASRGQDLSAGRTTGHQEHGTHQDHDVTDRVGETDALREGGRREGAGHDTSGPDTDSAMTRSEEQVHVGTTTENIGKARLRKYVVTENVTKTVPVSHEEVRIEREPITDANIGDATSGGDITEEEHEVELKGERVVVDKEAVPVERVRMDTETVTEDQQVSEEVRKEQIESETGDATEHPSGQSRH